MMALIPLSRLCVIIVTAFILLRPSPFPLSGVDGFSSMPHLSRSIIRSCGCRQWLLRSTTGNDCVDAEGVGNIITETDPNIDHNDHDSSAIYIQKRRSFLQHFSILLTPLILLPQASRAMYTDPSTKILLPSLGEIEASLPTTWSPSDNPFLTEFDSKSSFARLNSKPDTEFYSSPRFVEHVDDNAVETITKYLSDTGEGVLRKGDKVLDLCTSWTSHITPSAVRELELTRVAGLGMNEEEMKGNKILTDYRVVDLNAKRSSSTNPLPYDDGSFDVVICQLSIDYLTRPLEVLADVSRILRPDGRVHVVFSNRLFLEKAVGLWTGKDDVDHAYTVGAYLRFCGGEFGEIRARDLSKRMRRGKEMVIQGDPVYVVTAVRGKGEEGVGIA